jgi:hypothetical protein
MSREFEDLENVILQPEDGDVYRRVKKAKKLRLVDNSKEQHGLLPPGWTKVSMAALMDRAWDALYPPKVRLYLYLQNEVRKHNPITLTNADAAKLGLNRQNKWRALHELETRGLITVVAQDGHQASVVLWHPGPPTSPDPSPCP